MALIAYAACIRGNKAGKNGKGLGGRGMRMFATAWLDLGAGAAMSDDRGLRIRGMKIKYRHHQCSRRCKNHPSGACEKKKGRGGDVRRMTSYLR